jgi:general secretion pathway protein I
VSKQRIRGFTLIEVVIALAILGLSLGVLYGALENALARTRRDERLSEGTLVAQSLLSRAGLEFPMIPGTVQGEWNGYSYTLTQQSVAPPAGQPQYTLPPVRVIANVTWVEGGRSRDISLSTLKLLPKAER